MVGPVVGGGHRSRPRQPVRGVRPDRGSAQRPRSSPRLVWAPVPAPRAGRARDDGRPPDATRPVRAAGV